MVVDDLRCLTSGKGEKMGLGVWRMDCRVLEGLSLLGASAVVGGMVAGRSVVLVDKRY